MKIAMMTAISCDVIRFSRLYRIVLRVISQPVPDENRYLKLSNPLNGLPNTPMS